jgi:hypothetical protein
VTRYFSLEGNNFALNFSFGARQSPEIWQRPSVTVDRLLQWRFCVDQVLRRAEIENWHVTKVLCDCRAIKHLNLHRSVCQLRL